MCFATSQRHSVSACSRHPQSNGLTLPYRLTPLKVVDFQDTTASPEILGMQT